MFEQEYRHANDRIHPRKDLLKEMEKKWAAEAQEPSKEAGKILAFPTWAKYVSAAAGILLCVGIGMGSVLLFTRGGGKQEKYAAAEAPMMTAEMAVDQEEAKILTDTTAASNGDLVAGGLMLEAKMAAAPTQGMHPAADEAEVEDTIRYGSVDRGEVPMQANREAEAHEEAEAAVNEAPKTQAQSAVKTAENPYPQGEILFRDDLMAVFLPTVEQIQVLKYADKRVNKVFSLTLRQRGAKVQRIFWMGHELLALRERNGETELLRFDVTDFASPRHLQDLSQSGAFLGAWEMGGRLYILSLWGATEQEPLPWINGDRMDYGNVLLDSAKPGDTFTVITVYDPDGGDGFAAQTALLTAARGAAAEAGRLLLWAGEEETDLYVLAWDQDGLTLKAQGTRPSTVLDAGPAGESFSILLQNGDDLELVTVDQTLNEEKTVAGKAADGVRFARVYESGAMVLTHGGLHWLTEAGDSVLDVTGDGFVWLTLDRGLVLAADGRLQVVDVVGYELEARGTIQVNDGLVHLLEDPSCLSFDLDTGRLAFPAGQKVYQYLVSETGELTLRGTPLTFSDHSETDQRELRCLLTEDRALVFYKTGVHVCNLILERMLTTKY